MISPGKARVWALDADGEPAIEADLAMVDER
jgi:hypothetical protein